MVNKIFPFVYLTLMKDPSTSILNYHIQTRDCKRYNQNLVWSQLKSWHFDKNSIVVIKYLSFLPNWQNSITDSSIHFWLFLKKNRLYTVAQTKFLWRFSGDSQTWRWLFFVRQKYNIKIHIFYCGCIKSTQK